MNITKEYIKEYMKSLNIDNYKINKNLSVIIIGHNKYHKRINKFIF